jgi:hypothetical protein
MRKAKLKNWLLNGPTPGHAPKAGPKRTDWLQIERKMRYLARQRAKKAIEELTLIMGRLPEQDYAKIFQDETTYFNMLEACNKGYVTGVKAQVGDDELQDALIVAGMGHYGKRKLADPPTRHRLLDALIREKGLSSLTVMWTRKEAIRSEPIAVYIQRSKIERGRSEVENKARSVEGKKIVELNKRLLDMWCRMRSEERAEERARKGA